MFSVSASARSSLSLQIDILGIQRLDDVGRMRLLGIELRDVVFVFTHDVFLTHQPSNRPTTFAVWSTMGMMRP